MAGWQKVYRDIQNHWLWEDKPFSRGQAFIDLILLVNHQDSKALIDGELIEVKRGSKITSLRKLGEAWGWSSKKVKKFLEQLEKDKMISYTSDSKKTVVTIENYSVYQDVGNTEETGVFQENEESENLDNANGFNSNLNENLKGNGKEAPLDIDNTVVQDFKGNSEETQRKQQRNTEETVRKHRGNSEEIQRKTNKKDKEWKEGKEDNKKKRSEFDVIISSYTNDVDVQNAIYEFIKMRKTIKKPMTSRALNLLLNKLDKLASDNNTAIEILNQSILNCWQGIFEIKGGGRYGHNTSSSGENKKWNYTIPECELTEEERRRAAEELL